MSIQLNTTQCLCHLKRHSYILRMYYGNFCNNVVILWLDQFV